VRQILDNQVDAMTPKSLRTKISKLRVAAPITKAYAKALMERGIWSDEGVWYSSQKEHWMGWLSQYDGPGAYGRKTWGGRSAEYVYNHIGCPPMLLWVAEAAGVSRKALLSAKRSALASRKRISNCAAIREEIPWSFVEERLRGRSLS
jgi:hypothetical protein